MDADLDQTITYPLTESDFASYQKEFCYRFLKSAAFIDLRSSKIDWN